MGIFRKEIYYNNVLKIGSNQSPNQLCHFFLYTKNYIREYKRYSKPVYTEELQV